MQAGNQGLRGTGEPARYAENQVDVDVPTGRQPVPGEQPLQRTQLAKVEDLVLGNDRPVLHPGVQLDDELPSVTEHGITEVDRTHRAGRHLRPRVEHP